MIKRCSLLVLGVALAASAALADDVLDYGEYLSGECTGCHKRDGTGTEIPNIIGWDVQNFIDVMLTYKTGERTNPAMVSVVKALDDEQIKALAVYFASLAPK